MRKELSFQIKKNADTMQEGTFHVPSACKQIRTCYDLSMEYTFLVFMVVTDPHGTIRFQKQLSYSEPLIQIGHSWEETTMGGVPGVLEKGKWTLRIYLFAEHLERLVQEKEIPFHVLVSDQKSSIMENMGDRVWVGSELSYVNYDFDKVYQKKAKWYRGDLHTHTRLSDGKELPVTANEKSKKMNLDYYIPTEHNVLHTGWPDTDVMILPGVEITTTLGHANLFGIDRIPRNLEDFLCHKEVQQLEEDTEQLLRECRERDWLFSMNHPFLYIWKWNYDDLRLKDLNCLEIINDPTYAADPAAKAEEANQKAILLADLLWEEGYRICAVGGSDSHNTIEDWYEGAEGPSIPGDPATYLYMEELTPHNLLAALKDCRCYVTRHCTIQTNLMFGKSYPQEAAYIYYKIELQGQLEKPDFYYIHNGEKVHCEKVEKTPEGYLAKGRVYFKDSEYDWVRFGANTKAGEFLFYGNALTRGSRNPESQKYGEIRKKLEKRWESKEFYSTKMEP